MLMIVAQRPIAAQKCNKMAQLNINKTQHFDQSNASDSQTAVRRGAAAKPQNCHKHFHLGLICLLLLIQLIISMFLAISVNFQEIFLTDKFLFMQIEDAFSEFFEKLYSFR